MAEEFTRGNEEQVRLKAERKAGEERDALRMMHEFNERLRVQEEERFAALEAMKAKQRRQEELGTAVGPYKRYIDDKIIQRNFDKREADLAAREDAAKADIQLKREKLRAGLDQQLEEKNRLKAEEKARDRRMDDMLLEGARIADVYALEKQREVQEKMARSPSRPHCASTRRTAPPRAAFGPRCACAPCVVPFGSSMLREKGPHGWRPSSFFLSLSTTRCGR